MYGLIRMASVVEKLLPFTSWMFTKIVFALVDEICDVFESNAFHAGMDEVFLSRR